MSQPRFFLHNQTQRYMPKESWWIRPREGFTAECWRQWEGRMRQSKFAGLVLQTPEGRTAGSLDNYRSRKRWQQCESTYWQTEP